MPPQSPLQQPNAVAPTQNKFIETAKVFVSYGARVSAITTVVAFISAIVLSSIAPVPQPYLIGTMVTAFIISLIFWYIGGLVFATVYGFVSTIVKGIPVVNNYIKSAFDLLWKPYLVITVIGFIFNLLALVGITAASNAVAAIQGANLVSITLIVSVVNTAVSLYTFHWFSKKATEKLSAFYPW